MTYEKAPEVWDLPTKSPRSGVADPVMAQIYAEMTDAEIAQLTGGAEVSHDPFELLGMEAAVNTITQALKEKRQMIAYGDFDCDGVSALSVLVFAFRSIGVDIEPYIPPRTDGYGLHAEPIAEFGKKYGDSCLISVDCGTSSDDVAAGRPKNMLMAITDHHLPQIRDGKEVLANAQALVNPKQERDQYPFDGLAGAGVAYKLVQALEMRGVFPKGTADSVVGFAAVGTIVKRGLEAIRLHKLPGVSALMNLLKVKSDFNATKLQFTVIPCINSAGRMQDAQLALNLFIAPSEAAGQASAEKLLALNNQRKALQKEAIFQALQQVTNFPPETSAIVINSVDWPMNKDAEKASHIAGIVGLVAGRFADTYQLPAFVVSGNELRGSSRSAGGVNVKQALEEVADLLEHYGGHEFAAGFTIKPGKYEEFKVAIDKAVRKQLNGPRERHLKINAVLTGADLNAHLVERLRALEPFGQGNPKPRFAILNAKVIGVPRRFGYPTYAGGPKPHLDITLRTDDNGWIHVVSFSDSRDERALEGKRLDVCGAVEVDSYNNRLRMVADSSRPAQKLSSQGIDGLAA